ncbi:conjugal transfer protein TraI [Niabella sp.]|uniref:conjugal transfer protein TraI n=1 Tax=Niabella sp. TaxID=1962976 RepID=UPI002633966E|nr:conjugal transfer protein TraI [Niabella sp.]
MSYKKTLLTGMLTGLLLFGGAPFQQASAIGIWQIIKEAIVKVIKAIDLAVQRVQNQTIQLQHIQKEIENAMAKLKLKEIAEWSEKQRKLFKTYYDELWKVKKIIAYYKRIKSITDNQLQLIKEYKRAYALISNDKNFKPKELIYIFDVYTGILDESAKNIDELMIIVQSFSSQMSDAARLELIAKTDTEVSKNLSHLRRFTNQNILLSIERTKDKQEQQTIKTYYGLQ